MQRSGLTVRRGDSYMSPVWAIVLDAQPVDLTDGWTVRAQLRDRDDAVVVDFGATSGTSIVLGTAGVEVGSNQITTSTIRLYLSAEATSLLRPRAQLPFDIEIEHPTFGPLGDLFRVTVVSDMITVFGDVTRAAS